MKQLSPSTPDHLQYDSPEMITLKGFPSGKAGQVLHVVDRPVPTDVSAGLGKALSPGRRDDIRESGVGRDTRQVVDNK